MPIRSFLLSLALLSASTFLMCGEVPPPEGEQYGIPQPEPIPNTALMAATGEKPGNIGQIDIIGFAGTVSGAGDIEIAGSQAEIRTQANASGGFAVTISARGGEELQIRYMASAPALFKVPEIDDSMPRPAAPGPDPELMMHLLPEITAPVDGETTIQGVADQAYQALAVNFASGETSAADTEENGQFTIQIAAASGDEIRVYTDAQPLVGPWTLIVP